MCASWHVKSRSSEWMDEWASTRLFCSEVVTLVTYAFYKFREVWFPCTYPICLYRPIVVSLKKTQAVRKYSQQVHTLVNTD